MITKQEQIRVLQLIAPNTLGGAERVVLSIQEWVESCATVIPSVAVIRRDSRSGFQPLKYRGGSENRQHNRHFNYDMRHLPGFARENGGSGFPRVGEDIQPLKCRDTEIGEGEGEGEGTRGNFASSLGIFTWVKKPENAFLREVSARRYPHVIFPMRFAFDWANLIQLFRYIKANRIQLLHTHGYRSDILGLICARAAGIPVVTTLHGWTASDWMVRRYEDVQRLGLPFFTAIIAVSEEIKDRLVRQGGPAWQGGLARQGGLVRPKELIQPKVLALQEGLAQQGGLIRQGVLIQQRGLVRQGGAMPSFPQNREPLWKSCPWQRESILDRLRGIDPAKITVLQNAVSIPQEAALNILAQAAERGQIRQQFGCDPDALVIGFVGRLSPEKNPADLLKATNLLAPRIPNLLCWVVGEGPERSSLEKQARDLGITQRVRFLGFQACMSRIYQALDVLAITSRTEGTPMALLEAMSWSIPVVSYRVGGIGALLEHDVDGLLVNPGDTAGLARSLERVLSNPALSQELGKAAREKVRARFAMDGWIQKIREVYGKCLGGGRGISCLWWAVEKRVSIP